MDYEFSKHASDVIIEREIDVKWLELTLTEPELVLPDDEDSTLVHHLRKIHAAGNRVLRVVFNNQVNPIRIVTVYFDRTMKGRT